MHEAEDRPVFDRRTALESTMGDEALLREAVMAFLEDAPADLSALADALAAGDAGEAERRAHALKGAAATLGAARLQAIAHAVESAARAGDLGLARAESAGLGPALSDFGDALEV